MPCNAVHIGSDKCDFDPEFGPIPNALEALEYEDTFHEDGDSVDLKPDSEEDSLDERFEASLFTKSKESS